MWKLYDDKTGEELHKGCTVRNSDEEEYTLTHLFPPHKPSSSGKVEVTSYDLGTNEDYGVLYYPGVIGATWKWEGEGEPCFT